MSQGKKTSRTEARHAARQLALQGLYQWHMTSASLQQVERQIRMAQPDDGLESYEDISSAVEIADLNYFSELLHNIPANKTELDANFEQLLDRRIDELDPVELAILRIGSYELSKRLDVPYRVVINEGIELAKRFGATESHKYVNGILDRLAQRLRNAEVTGRNKAD
ncbi:NusB antitermination factor [Oceanospirillum multiglobuliferum]|uniref:Transcription antitermination protein NusB n=1 Tax=Oceanospirillum multiglobuliferum TaxID=64969 RepID=A0A1T4S3F4_9GAMM|nr:transcription antitermination factor NusB [Oceanospirillum multiglobuliferum]OPX54506.1 N utilization substance protein B [Oceanospirillum multiglobuliferum]SKA22754.1 NusB antitermination factor [Oceanospirillum multiglobuliferum]